MKKYLKILLELPTYVKVVVLVVLWFAAMALINGGISQPKRSWKSGGTTATYSDGTLRVRPSWGIAVSYAVDEATGLDRVPKIRWRGAMKDYNIIAPPWRSVCDSIINVVIEPGVTYIGNGTFANQFHVLKSITIPNTVTEIGRKVFEEGMSLKSITIPESVTKIGAKMFPNAHGGWGYSTWRGMYSITSLNPVPPAMDVQHVCVKTILYVPDGSVEAYRAADVWNGFEHIKSINDKADDGPSLEQRNCFCGGICRRDGKNGCEEKYYFQEKSVWIEYITRILMLYGIAYWLYLLLVFMLKKKYRVESKRTKVLSIILTPILTFVICFLWMLGGNYFFPLRTGRSETLYLPYYFYEGAITYGGIYLAVAAIFYQVFRKRIKRQATIIILATLHIIIFANLIIGGGL